MKILITGAAGFIGSRLAQRLLARGDTVVGLDNFISAYYDSRHKERNVRDLLPFATFSLVRGDIRDVEGMQTLFNAQAFDSVAHIAGMASVRYSIQRPLLYEEINVRGTMVLLEAARYSNQPHFVIASTSSVYGAESAVPFREEMSAMKPLAPYPATKRAVELMVHAYHNMANTQATIVRFFNVYGPHGRPDMMPWHWTDSILQHKPLSVFNGGRMWRDWTYIDDILSGVIAAIDARLPLETFNLGRGQPVENSEFINTLQVLLDEEAILENAPLPQTEPLETFADVGKARALLGYDPQTTVAEGLRLFVEWYRAEGLMARSQDATGL